MLKSQPEIFSTVGLISIFFLTLVITIIITAILYHARKRTHKIDLSNFQNILIQSQYEVQEQTLQTIGAELHDNIGQLLSLTSLTLNSVEVSDAEKAQQKIDTAIDLTVRSIKEMRTLGRLLQGEYLINLGLKPAIDHQAQWLEKTGHFMVNYQSTGEWPAISNSDKDLIIFRITQEVINNIIKHAACTKIDITLQYADNQTHLKINDNGIGFDITQTGPQGMGLKNIARRAAIIGGTAQITSEPGQGTAVDIYIPYP